MRQNAAQADPAQQSQPYATYVLCLLTAIYILGYLDRNIINLLLTSIKQEFRLSDTVLGLITGLGFTLFQLTLAIPIARWADGGRRVTILTFGLFLWSLMTGLSGLVPGALALAAARMGVGVGEACLTSPSHSLLSDYFSKDRRPHAFSIMAAGGEIGIILALLLGGWISHLYGWRAAFFVAGVPGILLAILCHFTVREPARGAADGCLIRTERPSVGASLTILWAQKSFVFSVIGSALMGLNIFGFQVWSPSFLLRAYHLNMAQVGTTMAILRTILAVSGAVFSGYLTEKLARRNDAWRFRWPAIICLVSVLGVLCFAFSTTLTGSLIGLGVVNMMVGAQLGPVFAAAQTVVPAGIRALASSLFVFAAQIVGLGFGSLAIGMVSDALHPAMGDHSLQYALLIPALGALAGGIFYWIASNFVVCDMREAARIDLAQSAP